MWNAKFIGGPANGQIRTIQKLEKRIVLNTFPWGPRDNVPPDVRVTTTAHVYVESGPDSDGTIIYSYVASPGSSEPEMIVTEEILERFRAYHAKESAWGWLHVVLDDGNVEDSSVEVCIECASEDGDQEALELGKILLQMSEAQRLKLYETDGEELPPLGNEPGVII
jgi:hypothetical protein